MIVTSFCVQMFCGVAAVSLGEPGCGFVCIAIAMQTLVIGGRS